jgi:hypothetical protein
MTVTHTNEAKPAAAEATEKPADVQREPKEPKAKKDANSKQTAPKRVPKGPAPDMTLQDLNEQYVAHLAASGKSHGTCFSYQLELNTACRVIGADTKLASLTAKDVHKYFNSGPVTLLKSGRPKAKPSVDKTRRVLRLALVWAASKKWIEKAPLPEAESK